MPSLSMVFDILAVDRASEVFKRVGDSAEVAGTRSEAGMARVESSMSKVAAGLSLAAAATAVVSVKMAGDFQQQTNILVTAAGESQSALAGVRKGILDIAQGTGTRWQDLTDGMYQVEKAGIRGADGLLVLKAAAQAAREEGANLATVTNATTSVMASYHLGADQAVAVTNQLKTAAGESKTTMEQFAGSLSTVLPLASANGVSFADVAGSLASLTQHGTTADEATQELAFSIRNLAAPNNVAIQTMGQLGISSTDVALKLGDGPGGRGLAGTLKYLSETVLQQMGPAGLVLLDTFKQSATAGDAMKAMLASMPPQVKALSEQFAAGSLSVGDYRKAFKDLPTDQASMAQQFVALAGRSEGFNNSIKAGGPIAATYSDQMKKIMGGANGLNTALQLTGESAAGTAARIDVISRAGENASKNVAGWESTQKLFNVQMDRFGQTVEAGAINLGTKLLPALTGGLSWVSDTGVPALKSLGGELGGLARDFGELPGPVKMLTEAFIALKVASALGITTALAGGLTSVAGAARSTGTSVMALNDNISVQQALMAAEARDAELASGALGGLNRAFGLTAASGMSAAEGLTAVQMSMRGLDASLAATIVEEDAAVASTGRLTASLAAMQASTVAAASAGGGRLLSMLGGPWGAAMLGATIAVMAVVSAIQKAKQTQDNWTAALEQGGAAAAKANAEMIAQDAAVRKSSEGFMGFINKIDGYNLAQQAKTASTKDATKAALDNYNSLGLVDQKTRDLSDAEYNLQQVMKTHPANSLAVTTASQKLQSAQQDLKYWQDLLNNAMQTAAQKAQALSQNELTLAGSGMAAKQSYDEFKTSLDQYRTDAVDPTIKGTSRLTLEQDALNSSALSVAQAAGTAGEAWAKANGVTDTATASQYAQLLSLQKVQQAMGTDTPAAVSSLITSLRDSVAQGSLTQKQMDAITAAVDGIPGSKNVAVTADTGDAKAKIDALLSDYQHVEYTGSAIKVNGRVLANAEGNMVPMSSSVATVVKPGTLRVIGDNPVADEAFIPLNNAPRSHKILGEAAQRMGYGLHAMAAGGITEMFPVQASQGMLDSIQAISGGMAAFGGGASGAPASVTGNAAIVQSLAAARGWTGSEWNALYNLVQRESGFRNTAQNPTSTAYGMFQFLNSTWAGYGIGKTSDPGLQAQAGLAYIAGRYGDPLKAWAHETSAGWYEQGTSYVPRTGPAVLHEGEAVLTKAQNAARGGPMQITGTLDLGNGLVGLVQGQIAAADQRSQLASAAGSSQAIR